MLLYVISWYLYCIILSSFRSWYHLYLKSKAKCEKSLEVNLHTPMRKQIRNRWKAHLWIIKWMTAEFHLAASVSVSWCCVSWFTVQGLLEQPSLMSLVTPVLFLLWGVKTYQNRVFSTFEMRSHMHLLLTTWWKRWSQRRCWLCCHWLPLISCPHWPHCVYWSRMQCSFLLEQKRRHQEAGSRGIFLSCVAQVQEKNIFFPVSGWEVNYRNAGKINQLYSNHFIPWVAPFPSCKDTVNKASDNK